MIKEENIEKLFDVLDQSATLYYTELKTPYLEGLVKTCENILANSVETESEELNLKLLDLMNEISDIDFQKEEIRKAFQYCCLRGLKHQNISNQMITPESIAVFISYLVNKLYELNEYVIYDPLVGSGNLISGLANNLEKNTVLFGTDKEIIYYQLAQALFGMLEYGDNVYFQDALTFTNIIADLIVTDFSGVEHSNIYELIKHLHTVIRDDGFFISVVDNDFFDDESIKDFIFEVKDKWHFFGMIVLPLTIFKSSHKSIFILQKIGKDFVRPGKFLVADIPDFNNEEKMISVVNQLNNWFDNIEFNRVREKNEKNNGS